MIRLMMPPPPFEQYLLWILFSYGYRIIGSIPWIVKTDRQKVLFPGCKKAYSSHRKTTCRPSAIDCDRSSFSDAPLRSVKYCVYNSCFCLLQAPVSPAF